MNLSVIIPCYNELSSIEQVVQSVMEAEFGKLGIHPRLKIKAL